MSAHRVHGIVWRWHVLAGLIACPIGLVIALTGALYTFQPELDPIADARLTVRPAATHAPLDAMLPAARAQGCQPIGINLPSDPTPSAGAYRLGGAEGK